MEYAMSIVNFINFMIDGMLILVFLGIVFGFIKVDMKIQTSSKEVNSLKDPEE